MAKHQHLALYAFLSRLKFLKSYKLKIFAVAFLGTHIPLIALLVYFVVLNSFSPESTRVLQIAVVATFLATVATLWILKDLLMPIVLTSRVLRTYVEQQQLLDLPTEFSDEVGMLMSNAQYALSKLDEIIRHISNYDSLTGLPNRALFCDRLSQAIATAKQNNRSVALLSLRLDNFDDINNAIGYSAGEVMLRVVAQRLSTLADTSHLLARLGDNIFGVAQTEVRSSNSIAQLAREILEWAGKPIERDRHSLRPSISIGIAIYPFDSISDDRLLQNSSTAMMQASQEKRGDYQFFSAEMNERLQERLSLEVDLRHALERQEILLYYQPRVEAKTGTLVAVEALVRWQHPTRGLVSPGKFIPIAEQTGLIKPMGEWILRQACWQNKQWQRDGLSPIRISVNLSARQFEQSNLVEQVSRILQETQLDPTWLELEVTETVLTQDIEQSVATLYQLRDLGVSLALDDFGTGYSSLNYLRRFPLDTLKIDKSFVQNATLNVSDGEIVQAIIALAQTLQLNVTAEGVETQEQLDYVKERDCHEVQGYYFSKPVDASRLRELLSRTQLN